jgi:hypothetical protein
MRYRLTKNQLAALTSLRDGKWRYGISINGRHSLTSLHKLMFVNQLRKSGSAIEWQIAPEGLKILADYIPELEKTG